jgi:uncharacterized membrane protein YagU involved in acid resistance
MASRLLRPTEETNIDRVLVPGVLAGMVAAIPMALVATLVTAFQDRGFLRPAYQVAFVIVGEETRTSLEGVLADDPFFVEAQMVFFGAVMHLAVGGFFGALFAFLAPVSRFPRHRLLIGAAYGLLVMAVMSAIVLPLVALVLDAGPEVWGFPSRLGWPLFVLQHLVYGLMLGWWKWYGPWGVSARDAG